MRLNHAEITGAQLGFPPSLSVVMTVVVDVYNPNGYDVAIRAMRGQCIMGERYTLPVDFRPGGEGVWLYSNATTSVRVPMVIPVPMAMDLLAQSFSSPTIPYHLVGSADVTASHTFKIEKDDYSVDETGFIPREAMQRVVVRPF
jgi:hypothetical protein